MSILTRAWRLLVAAACFVLLALAWTWPVSGHLSSLLPGPPGDNLDFLWNSWWMRQALASPATDFFSTNVLFAPFGIDLTLHTHTALPSWLAASLPGLSILAAHNAVVVASLALNGVSAYLLAWDRTRDHQGALLAGLVFAGSPYLAGHLTGHINLIGAWGIPFFLLFLLRALGTGSIPASLAAGVCLAATAFTDYYYVVYSVVLAAGLASAALWPLSLRLNPRPLPRWLSTILVLVLAIDTILVIAIVVSGGFVADIAGVHVTAARPTNLLAIGWGLLIAGTITRLRPRLVRTPAVVSVSVRSLVVVAATACAVMSPLLIGAWRVWERGDYAAPRIAWRSGPAGVDLATLVLGNPWHPITGGWTRQLYDRLGIDAIEGMAWLGIVPLALAVWTIVRHSDDREVRRWIWIGTLFFVWALGPWLHVGGFDTGLLLPQNILALVPVLSNARMPGRAIVVVFLSMGMLAAFALRGAPAASKRVLFAALAVLVIADYLPAPVPATTIDVPALYVRLRDMPPGAVCELPAGLRDGFGMIGAFDDRVVSYQMVHGHPIVGGFAARIPDSLKRRYEESPILRTLLKLSGGEPADPRDQMLTRAEVGQALRGHAITYVVLNRDTAPAGLVAYVERAMPLTLVVREGSRELYVIE